MEGTGNYWITLYDVLTEAGIEVYLVNARHVKGVPGKKTDVRDAQWLQQLHGTGLLRKSFRPALGIVPLRFLMPNRAEMVGDAAKQLQLKQKSLTEMNLKPQHFFSDIDGVSAQAIIDAILVGERDSKKLAALRDKRCRSSAEDIIEALREAIAVCDAKHGGVPDVSTGPLCALISEVGTREQLLSAFPTPERFASWMGLCPDNRISGGTVLKAKTRKVQSRLAGALRLGVFGLQRSQPQMGGYLRRIKGKLGKAEGTTAAAHKLARILHGVIKSQKPYDEKEAFKLTPESVARRRKALEKQAAALDFTLQPTAA